MIVFLILISANTISATDYNNNTEEIISNNNFENITSDVAENIDCLSINNEDNIQNTSDELNYKIINANDNDEILIEPGTYYLNNIYITKNITLQGNGNPRDIIIDGNNTSGIFLIRNDSVHAAFKNITFINANVIGFGGAISMETGHVYVDNCHFINNTASVNAGGISNYGTAENKGYLMVNNSLFVNNHADHDGGAITTCYANSDIYNCVFIGNSAHRDGGAIRVSVQGYGNVQDCIFMYNHADEWGGAYYSWSGTSNINRCIFLNNTAGTNGGAVMVSGDINLENSIIVNNSAGETGGSFYIQQPMYDARTVMNIHNNLITNNTSPYGKEIFIYWNDTTHLHTKFNDNDWGDEDPNDPSVIDPDNVTPRSKVTSTIKSDLLNVLNLNLLKKYSDLIKDYFPDDYLNNTGKQENNNQSNSQNDQNSETNNQNGTPNNKNPSNDQNKETNNQNGALDGKNTENNNHNTNLIKKSTDSSNQNTPKKQMKRDLINDDNKNTKTLQNTTLNNPIIPDNTQNKLNSNNNSQVASDNVAIGNSTSHGNEKKAYELNATNSASKTISSPANYFILPLFLGLAALIIGYRKEKVKNK